MGESVTFSMCSNHKLGTQHNRPMITRLSECKQYENPGFAHNSDSNSSRVVPVETVMNNAESTIPVSNVRKSRESQLPDPRKTILEKVAMTRRRYYLTMHHGHEPLEPLYQIVQLGGINATRTNVESQRKRKLQLQAQESMLQFRHFVLRPSSSDEP